MAWALTLGTSVGCPSDGHPPGKSPDQGPDDETGTSGGELLGVVGDVCEDAIELGPGVFRGSLRARTSTSGGACGRGGPEVFHRVHVPRRADLGVAVQGRGFTARAGMLPDGCVLDWSTAMLGCTDELESWLTDVPAGSGVVIAVGIDPLDPALAEIVDPGALDPLDYALTLELREILSPGEVCESDDARCESGTVCLPYDPTLEPTGDATGSGPPRCWALWADDCASPERVTVTTAGLTLQVPPEAIHTDAHRHRCGGARTVERVVQLSFAEEIRTPATVELRTEGAVALAVRSGSCEPEAEVACGNVEGGGSLSFEIDEIARIDGAFVFIELPAVFAPGEMDPPPSAEGGEEPPAPVLVDVVVR